MPRTSVRHRSSAKLPPEVANIVGATGAIFAVVATGSGILAVLPDPSMWQTAAAYLAPASLAFAAHWWIAQEP